MTQTQLHNEEQGKIQGGRGDIRLPLTDSGRGVASHWDFEAKNVPYLINVIVNDKFRIGNL